MTIRRMTEADLEAVTAIMAAASCFAAIWTRVQLEAMLAKPALYEAYVAEEEAAVRGFLYFHVAGDEAELDNLAVAPGWRRRGIATQLLETAWHRAVERGATAMFLEVRPSNAAALRLYQRCGFVPAGVRRGYYRNPAEDALRMVKKRLPNPAETC